MTTICNHIFQGFRVVQGFECWHKSLTPLMEEVRAMMGSGPVYISFDIDALDPSFAPGTGISLSGGATYFGFVVKFFSVK